MNNMKKILLLILSAMLFASCEDVIDVDLEDGTPQLTVDAILTNMDEPQRVRLPRGRQDRHLSGLARRLDHRL